MASQAPSSSAPFYPNAVREYVSMGNSLRQSAEPDSWLARSEIPTTAEMFDVDPFEETADNKDRITLPVNIIDGPWPSKEDYLKSHYALLRENAVRPLRKAVECVRRNEHKMEYELPRKDAGFYEHVYITGITFSTRGIATRVVFSLGRVGKKIHWEQSKRLLSGSLVALSPADGMFSNKCIIAVVAARPISGLVQNPPEIDLYFARAEEQELDCQKEWVMVESRSGFFEAERHTLLALQKLMAEPFPLKEHFVRVDQIVPPPNYVAVKPHTDLRNAFRETDTNSYENIDILNDWPESPRTSMDKSQLKALKTILTKRLAIVQGPPGTGKTHVSVVALDVLLSNMVADEPPIIVACQTNHALDQLLRHVAEFEPEFARLGGRSKDRGVIKAHTLYELRQMESNPNVSGGLKRPAIKRMNDLAKETAMLLSTLEKGKGLTDHNILVSLRIMKAEHAQSLTDGDTEYVSHEAPSEGKAPIHAWLGKSLIISKSPHRTDDFGFEYEEADLDFEQLQELEAENIAQDDEDYESLRGTFVSLGDSFTAKDSDIREAQIEAFLDGTSNLWKIPVRFRGPIFCYWQRQAKARLLKIFRENAAEFNELAIQRRVGKFEEDAIILAKQKIIGLTTTGFSKYRALIAALKPKIVLIEEAAETLEAPVIATCLPSVEHLILVGDHQQLRPNTHVQQLQGAPHFLNVSLFERLVNNNVEFSMLKRQRRMMPEIRRILRPIYGKKITDHPSMADPAFRPPVPGMGGVNSFFFTHEWIESRDDNMSAVNAQEAEMIVGFYKYLIFNGLDHEEITVLTFYNGQRKMIMRLLRNDHELQGRAFKVVTVDSYQGEENKVILLSLVRSNGDGNIGFLNVDNRVCVALSRAKCGFYLFGNAELLCEENKTWAEIVTIMVGKGSSREVPEEKPCRVGYRLPLQCENHGRETWVEVPDDWTHISGGCLKKCHGTLPCGHKCTLRCHPFAHGDINCTQKCTYVLDCGHGCADRCCDPCRCGVCVKGRGVSADFGLSDVGRSSFPSSSAINTITQRGSSGTGRATAPKTQPTHFDRYSKQTSALAVYDSDLPVAKPLPRFKWTHHYQMGKGVVPPPEPPSSPATPTYPPGAQAARNTFANVTTSRLIEVDFAQPPQAESAQPPTERFSGNLIDFD